MGSSSNLVKPSINPRASSKKATSSPFYPLCALIAALFVILVHFYFNQNSTPNNSYNSYSSAALLGPFKFASSQDGRLTPSPSPSPSPSPNQDSKEVNSDSVPQTTCDYSKGEWVPTDLAPLYNGTTCGTIKQGQNCAVYGRPDKGYLHWRWQPQDCDLPRFDPDTFLELLQNKHIAFVGDSLARNQLESMLCLMSSVSKPNLFYTNGDDNKFRKWHFPTHNINVSIYWSPFLAKGIEKTPPEKDYNIIDLDSVDEKWAGDLGVIDVLVLSAGQWYLLPAVYRYEDEVLGCHIIANCTEIGVDNCTQIGFYDAYRKALNTTLHAVVERRGISINKEDVMDVFVITFPPAHFEGDWDKLGSCSKKQPYKAGEQVLEGMNAEMRKIGVEQLEQAKLRAEDGDNNSAIRLQVLDVSELALLRPDGHPGPYMSPFPFANGVADRVPNDCVHWCLPGAIDTWNEILLQLIKKRART